MGWRLLSEMAAGKKDPSAISPQRHCVEQRVIDPDLLPRTSQMLTRGALTAIVDPQSRSTELRSRILKIPGIAIGCASSPVCEISSRSFTVELEERSFTLNST